MVMIKMMDRLYLDKQIEELYQCQPLSEQDVIKLCEKAKQVLRNEPNVVQIKAPVIICGDTHGQFQDLMEIFDIAGKIPFSNYLFLGDYVNRGHYSIETFSLLLALKLRYKDRLTLLRGNHEARQLSQTYEFYDQCHKKYGNSSVWKSFTEVFDCLPLAAVVQNSLFCVHGGLSPSLDTLNDINNINRFHQIPHEGGMCDLVWTYVQEERKGWVVPPKGAGYSFGQDVTKEFNHKNGMDKIIRAHELVMEGHKTVHDGKLSTVFSAPNYCYRCGNQGAVLDVDEKVNLQFITIDPAPRKVSETLEKRFPDYFI